MSAEDKGFPVQILWIDFKTVDDKRTSDFQLNTEELDKILAKTGERDVVLISIVGPSRQGKSYMLGFLIRYLESLSTEDTDWFGYEDPGKPLEGFKWRNGIDPETAGMWMWSQPFSVKMGTGKECAVLLMDTQGTYDEFTTQLEWSRIVGLSFLTSSCLIFNSFHDLQEDKLSSLGAFIDYGLLAQNGTTDSNSNGSHPFQKLVFLIRDWNTPSEFPYGAKGGKAFLNRKLEIKQEQGDEAKRIRASIRQCFEELDCFLMPDPGEKMKSKEYDGSVGGLSPKFAKNLESFVSDLLSPEELKVKMIGGNAVKGSELKLFFRTYVDVFNSDEIMNPLSLFEATSKIMNTKIVNNAVETYKKNMLAGLRKQSFFSDPEISKCHSKAYEKAMEQFESTKKSGDDSVITEYREKLVEDLENNFKTFHTQNSQKKTKIISAAREKATKTYIENIMTEIGDSFLTPDDFEKFSGVYKSEAITNFTEECSSEDPEILIEISIFESTLKHEGESLTMLNNTRIFEAEKANKIVVTQTIAMYLEKMTEETNKSPYFPIENLEALNSAIAAEAQQFYSNAEKHGDSKFLRKFDEELKRELTCAFATLKIQIEDKNFKLQIITDGVIDEMVKDYENLMSTIMEKVKSAEELKKEHEVWSKNIYSSFEASEEVPKEIAQGKIQELKKLIEKAFENFKRDFDYKSRDLVAECEKSCSELLQEFNSDMSEYLQSKEFHRLEDLEDEYTKLKSEFLEQGLGDLNVIGIPSEVVQTHLKNLEAALEASFGKFKDQNTLKQEHGSSKAQNEVSDGVRNYQSEMKKGMDKCRGIPDFDDMHRRTKDLTLDGFKSKYSNVHSSFVEPFTIELEKDIEKEFKELCELFQLKIEESGAGTKAALNDAQKFYKEEIEKHFKNQDFMRPSDLNKLHKCVTATAIARCEEKVTLNEIQKEDLSAAMERVYSQYVELNHMNMPTDPAIGIDLGTTFCCVGVYHRGKVTIIENNGKKTTPSYVSFKDTCEVVGEAAKNQAHENPENTIYDAKRIIGRKFNDPKLQSDMKLWPFTVVEEGKVPKIEVLGKTYHPEQISAKLLKEMKSAAEDHLGCSVKNAVITVPAYFNDGQRQATMDAGELAGLKVLNIMNEPTAAAVAYRLQHVDLEARNVLIFDLGGGTFDVAVLRISDGEIDVKAVDGDTHLGGEDFDNSLVDHCILEFQSQHGINLLDAENSTVAQERQSVWRLKRRLKSQCEDRKIDLASSRKVSVTVDAIKDGLDLNIPLTREKFEDMNAVLFAKTIEVVERVLASAQIQKTEIQDIVLVGGSTRIPKIQQLLENFFNGKALNKTINPDEAVAYGAAIQAAILNGEIAKDSVDFTKIQDVTPMSLGVQVYLGGFDKIIKKNTKVPVTLTETYKTAHNNQTSVHIEIFQGEDDVAVNNDKLGEFVMNGIPPGLAGQENIEVEMEIGEEGILHVTAKCCSTGGSKDLAITEYKNRLSRKDIQRLLESSTAD